MTGFPSVDQPWLKYYSKNAPEAPDPNCSMFDYLQKCNQNQHDSIALDYFGKKITYGKLFEEIDRTAVALQQFGVKHGDIVSVCPLNTPEFIFLLYAINKIGAVSNWMGLTSPIQDLHDQLTTTNSRIVFTVSIAYEQIEKAAEKSTVEKIITVPLEFSMPTPLKLAVGYKNRHLNKKGISWKDFIKAGEENITSVDIIPDNMALIEYTGGSTGVPKGVMLSNKAMNSYYVNFLKVNQCGITSFSKNDRFLFGVPLFLAFGASSCCHGPLCHTLVLVLAPDPSPEAGTKLILKKKINQILTGRLLIEDLVESTQKTNNDLSFIRSIMYGGEETNKVWEKSITEKLRDRNADIPLLNGYGMTETSAAILLAPDNETDGLIPLGNVNVKVVNPDDESQEYGYDTEGELCLSAETLMNGYYNNEKETSDVIFERDGVRWLKTHDLATISRDGIIKITGRIKRIYSRLTSDKIQVRVYPMRIEETLISNKLVHECAVVGIKDTILAYRSVAFIVLSDKTAIAENAQKQIEVYAHEHLPDSHWPDEYVFIEKMPITRAGKVDYRALEKEAQGLHS